MDLVIDSIECTKCKKILSTPLILPCGHCICEKHVTENETTKSWNVIYARNVKEEDKVINFLAVYLKPNPKYSFQ